MCPLTRSPPRKIHPRAGLAAIMVYVGAYSMSCCAEVVSAGAATRTMDDGERGVTGVSIILIYAQHSETTKRKRGRGRTS
jgi:hypothetical protein